MSRAIPIAELAQLVPAAGVLRGDAANDYAVDGMRPALTLLPTSVDDVAAMLRVAGERALAVTPWGGSTLMDLGNLPRRVDLVLDLSQLNAISDYQPDDLVVTAQAGITLAALNAKLAEHGQTLPLNPPLPEQATVGGTLSANASGPNRLRYGTARDLVIGLTCVLADGSIVHSGGRVVKNVAGYDMNKLYIGAVGTLGVIVEASFKLYPLPSAGGALLASFASPESACEAALGVVNSPYSPTAVEVVSPSVAHRVLVDTQAEIRDVEDGGWLIAVLVGGLPSQVERQTQEIARLLEQAGSSGAVAPAQERGERIFARLRDYGRSPAQPAAVILRSGVLPSEVADAMHRFQDAAGEAGIGGAIASPGAGLVRVYWSDTPPGFAQLLARIRESLAPLSGTVLVERCPPELKAGIDIWGIDGADLTLMGDMKTAFDPQGILNPGRFAGGI